jgi:hypothetical protein
MDGMVGTETTAVDIKHSLVARESIHCGALPDLGRKLMDQKYNFDF